MRRAITLAEQGWGQTAPNPMVGAVVVREGAIVGEGWHTRYGEAHAEVEALRSAGERARGATMFVTLEPCNHHGRTPPCTEAILAAGIRRVVIAVADPNPVAAGGAERLREGGVDVAIGLGEKSARELNAAFFHSFAVDRPFVQLKLALSLDGAMADHTRHQGWLTGDQARMEVHRLRAGADAVAVGIGTALADDPLLTVRGFTPPRVPPVRVVFDTSARLPLTSRLVQTAREIPVVWSAGLRNRRTRRRSSTRAWSCCMRRPSPTRCGRSARATSGPSSWREAPRWPRRCSRRRSSIASLSFGRPSCSVPAR
jgi:diaminohydroxyphosphoribosylaminopyrimidine deaminase / 5-amino-6-(5-phosphoribosylamino)uracil reductase